MRDLERLLQGRAQREIDVIEDTGASGGLSRCPVRLPNADADDKAGLAEPSPLDAGKCYAPTTITWISFGPWTPSVSVCSMSPLREGPVISVMFERSWTTFRPKRA